MHMVNSIKKKRDEFNVILVLRACKHQDAGLFDLDIITRY